MTPMTRSDAGADPQATPRVKAGVPPMPAGFTDRAAWDAIHWDFSADESYRRTGVWSVLSGLVIQWQRDNQERCHAAAAAAERALLAGEEGAL